jgi:DNA (cytosine-5)-methyltransferase 1
MLAIKYLKLSQNRGHKRVWLEGRRLADAGFLPGIHYGISINEATKALTICISGGHRVVSHKKTGSGDVPVIDLNNSELDGLFGEVSRIKVVIRNKSIEVTVHPDDQAVIERLTRLANKIKCSDPVNIGSLAHGGGIMDHALHEGLDRAGVSSRLSFAIEIEHDYLESSLRNNSIWDKDGLAICAPMEEVEPSILPKIEFLAAGLPCTGASLSGRTKNSLKFAEQHETAGRLFTAFLSIVKSCNPATIILENVPLYSTTISMHIIRDCLTHWGYEVHEHIVGPDIGQSLETRERMVMVAITRGIDFDWRALMPVRKKEQNLGEILDEVAADAPVWSEYSYLKDKEVRDISAGKGFRMQILGPEAKAVGTIGRGYSKVRSTEPKIQHPEVAGLMRQLSPAEHARVKTVPASLIAGLGQTTAHEILGQGVVHSAFIAIGILLGQSWRAWQSLVAKPTTDSSTVFALQQQFWDARTIV